MEIGDLVISKCGRDKGGVFLITAINGDYAFLVDGVLRKLAKPKKKKIKHIKPLNTKAEGIAGKIKDNKQIFDSEIKAFIRRSASIEKEGDLK